MQTKRNLQSKILEVEMNIRRATAKDAKQIVYVANNAFEPVRYEGYDFKQTMPIVYKNKDFVKTHFVCEENGNIIATAGNIIRDLKIGDVVCKFSNVGTVSTLPKHQGKGCMTMIMKEIEKENIEGNVAFSILTGDRKRYNHFGYEKAGFVYMLNVNKKLLNVKECPEISISEYRGKNEDDVLYEIYASNDKINLRSKEDFSLGLKSRKHKIYVIKIADEIDGYFTLDREGKSVDELYLQDINLLESAVCSILKRLGKEQMVFKVNPLDKEYFDILEKFSEEVETIDEIHFKVYDLKKFLEMLFELNKKIKKFENRKYIYSVDDKTYKITIKNNRIKIKEGKYTSQKSFSMGEFLRYILSANNSYEENKLTMIFALNYVDLF